MNQDNVLEKQERRDFFISYTSQDKPWAEWIAAQLDAAGYTFFFQDWDFRPGSNFVAEMDKATRQADRTLLVLSAAYLTSGFAFSEWAAAFRQDPTGSERRLLPVRIEPCEPGGLLAQIGYIDLVGSDAEQAKERLLKGTQTGRVRPEHIAFPGRREDSVAFPGTFPIHWNIPFVRNPLFTGREDFLERLHTLLGSAQAAVALSHPQAISGLGGIGKTQLAIEYAYRYRQEYQAVLWARADSLEALTSSYIAIAEKLHLPECNEQDQGITVRAVKRWLQMHQDWLLILDNTDEPHILPSFLPLNTNGHLLLTTRASTLSPKLAQRLELAVFTPEQGALLLLRCAEYLASDAELEQATPSDRELAMRISEELGGLPLALDQAGAYIAKTQCSLVRYLQRYQRQRDELLRYRSNLSNDYPYTVATTWSLNFQQVETRNPAAADLLRFCAFLDADNIPEELLTTGTRAKVLSGLLAQLGTDAVQLDLAIEALRDYSLIQRNPEDFAFSVHRLVQAVLSDALPKDQRRQWMALALDTVNAAFPLSDFKNWHLCERLLPHALRCSVWVEQEHLATTEAERLLNQVGSYLLDRGRYVEAEPLLQQAVAICEQRLGLDHPGTAENLNNLAVLYQNQGKYEEAESLYKRALAIREQQLGPEHPDTARGLNNLAALYYNQGKYAEAESLYKRALAIRERQLRPEHPDTAESLNNLAGLYVTQGKYAEAEPLLQQALSIWEQQLGAEHPNTLRCLGNLAQLYKSQGRYKEAEPLLQRVLAINEQQLGPEHPHLAESLNNLAGLYADQGRHAEAEPLYERALAICERQVGPEHPDTAWSLSNLANLYYDQEKYSEAEPLFQRALAIREQQLGPEHPDTATSLNNLAQFYQSRKMYAEAEPLLRRALRISEQQLGPEHPKTADILNNLSGIYYRQREYTQAEPLLLRALDIYEQRLRRGYLDPHMEICCDNLVQLYYDQRKYMEIKSFLLRVQDICERYLGRGHPMTRKYVNLSGRIS